ncbi:uncharacterized protein LOC8082600 isoform X2 [Sorghum bicolor]|uniref:uncharacterized protein LOC8082600 isoform X2 n=1 Tax=Sorghum bicolor TaxID=4558 RepID=UPI00081ADFCF|nr:uncharacterized protein LOC8082600 isoform X2 [Sorghum bicolor]|eukprot:XP_021306010.1 uncharacterized protein LOC8082600 isoform X2 [Sorghum bicolor]
MGECAPTAAVATASTAKTSVWWDIDKCAVPRGRCDPHRIAHNLIAALASAGYVGPVSIAAYGDAARVPPPVLAALSATGICLNHVPAGSKDTSEKRMLVDMLFWAFDNPPPGNYLLISGDQDLSDLLHRLRMKRYDILLVRPPNASSQVLAAAAKKVWLWENLTAGDLLLPEPPPPRSVLGCKLHLNSSDTLKCSHSKVVVDYGKSDCNGKEGSQIRARTLQKYVKKASYSSTPEISQDRVVPAGGVSQSSTGRTLSEVDHYSVSSLSSSSPDSTKRAKANTSLPLENRTLSNLSSHRHVLSTHPQAEATTQPVLADKPGISTGCLPRNAALNFGASNGQCNQMSQHFRCFEAQSKLHSEFTTGNYKGKAVNRHVSKPLQIYVKKTTNITFGSANKPVGSIGVPECPVGKSTIELDQASVSASATSTQSHSSAQRPIASAHLHQVKAPHESILGKKPSTSVELHQVKAPHEPILGEKPSTSVELVRVPHESILSERPSTSAENASRNGTHDSDVCAINYNPTYRQFKSSEAQNKLNSCSNVGDSSGKLGNEYKTNKEQPYAKWINIFTASVSNEINPSTRTFDNSDGSTSSYPSQSLSASSSSKSLQSAKDGATSIFGKQNSTSFQCAAKSGTFVFGASSGQYHQTYQQAQSSLPSEQHNSGTSIVHVHSDSIDSHRGSSASPSVKHNGVPFAQTQTCSSGSAFEGLDDICNSLSRLNISECPQGTTETRPQGPRTNGPSMGMPNNYGHPVGFHESRSSFHLDSNSSCNLNHSSDPQSGQPPFSDYTYTVGHQPNISSDMQSSEHSEDKPRHLPNSAEPEVGIILQALDILKTEKIFPTETNIADCICYGDLNLTGFDVKKALELAIRREAVVMKKLLNDMPLFVAKDESLWKCVNVTNTKAKNPTDELETVYKYISSPDGHSAMMNSQSRYQAAMILKRSCMQQYALGDILQVLHIVIVRKKWLVPHPSGWQPLSLITTADTATTDAPGKVKSSFPVICLG